jgi:hypothetical protein
MRYLHVGEGDVVLSPAAPTNPNALRNFCFYKSEIPVALVFLVCTVHAPKFRTGKKSWIGRSIVFKTTLEVASRYLVCASEKLT